MRGSEEIAMRDLPFLKDVVSGMVGELALMRGVSLVTDEVVVCVRRKCIGSCL